MNLILKIFITIIALAVVLLYFLPGSPLRIINYTEEGTKPALFFGCKIDIKILGAEFIPNWCEFQIISLGVACELNENNRPVSCPPDFALIMLDSDKSHVSNISLFNFKSLTTGVYKFSLGDFNGQLVDNNSTVKLIQSGTVTLESKDGNNVNVSFDVDFVDGIKVTGKGDSIPVSLQYVP